MSTAPDESPGHDPGDGRRVLLRVLAVVASIVAIAALWVGERQKANVDLQLMVQPSVRPGSTVAVRALVFRGLEAVQGPTLAPTPVHLTLRDRAGATLAETELRPDVLGSMGGVLSIPALPPGSYVLEGEAMLPGEPTARCRMALRVDPQGGALEPRGRIAGPLQHLAPGRLRPLVPGVALPALDPRVPGGVCVPESPCELWVRMGAPPAALEVVPTPSVEVVEGPDPAGETDGLVRVAVVVHGPEAETQLRALREGAAVAERTLRLPVGLGEVALDVERSVLPPGQGPRVHARLPPGRSELALDAFRDGDWRFTGALRDPPDDGHVDWPGPELAEGPWQLQARADPFSSDAAGARMVFVRPPGMDDETLLRTLDRLGTLDGAPPLLPPEGALPAWALSDVQRTAAYLLAPREQDRFPLPRAVSGRPAQLRRLSHTRNLLRFSVGAMLLLSALVVSGTMVRRELGEQAETRAALRDAGYTTVDTPLNRRRQAFWLWSMALGVAIAFVLAALLIVAKPLWF